MTEEQIQEHFQALIHCGAYNPFQTHYIAGCSRFMCNALGYDPIDDEAKEAIRTYLKLTGATTMRNHLSVLLVRAIESYDQRIRFGLVVPYMQMWVYLNWVKRPMTPRAVLSLYNKTVKYIVP